MDKTRGLAQAIFASVLLFLDGALNVIYGLAAIGKSDLLNHPTHYLLGNLDNWGWVALILGILELVACGSVLYGHRFGRFFGIGVGSLAAIAALLDMPAYPFWSLAVFGVSIWIIHGLATYAEAGEPEVELGPSSGTPVHVTPPM